MKNRDLTLLVLAFIGFISLGLPDAINGVVWPFVSEALNVPLGNLGILLFVFMAGYLASSLSIAKILNLLGVGGLLSLSGGLVALSLFSYAYAPNWPLYLASGVIAGLAAGAIDTGLNAYAAKKFTARHMSWLHACWGVGASSGAIITTAFISAKFSYPAPMIFIGVLMIPISILFFVVRHRWYDNKNEEAHQGEEIQKQSSSVIHALKNPTALLQALIFFIYVGLESTIGQWSFSILTKGRGVDPALAGTIVSMYWVSLTVGRFLLGSFADRLGVRKMILGSMITSTVAAVIFAFLPHPLLSLVAIGLLGFSLAPVYPSMMSQTPERMGHLSDSTVGLQISAAVLGQVVVPGLGGLIVTWFSIGHLNILIAALAIIFAACILRLFGRQKVKLLS